MKTMDFGVASEYNIRFSTSPIFECALGIAAFTREEIFDKLDGSLDDLRSMRARMTKQLQQEVNLAGEVHTWRSLLFLAHRCPDLSHSPFEQHIDIFLNWIQRNEDCLVKLAAPYLGEAYESELEAALSGNQVALQHLIQIHSDNPVIHLNLRYLFSVDPRTFLQHLKNLLLYWHQELLSDMPHTMLALQQDKQHYEQIADGLQSSELIRLVTKGSELQPHAGVDTLWLIPQSAYRPFTIINYLPHCVVYYYPISDKFLPGGIAQAQILQISALHKALGDVQRIRLLTLIRHSPKSLSELTNTLKATKSNVHHHLTLLRTAGLVQVEDGVYSINHEAISQVGTELHALLNL